MPPTKATPARKAAGSRRGSSTRATTPATKHPSTTTSEGASANAEDSPGIVESIEKDNSADAGEKANEQAASATTKKGRATSHAPKAKQPARRQPAKRPPAKPKKQAVGKRKSQQAPAANEGTIDDTDGNENNRQDEELYDLAAEYVGDEEDDDQVNDDDEPLSIDELLKQETEERDAPPSKKLKANSGQAINRTSKMTWEEQEASRPNAHIPLRPEERQKNGRVAGRGLIIWTRPRMIEQLVLHMQYEIARHQIDIPWDTIAHRLHPGSSGGAILQHLHRLRTAIFVQGHLIPPSLPKAGSRFKLDPEIRGFERADMEGTNTTSARAIHFNESRPSRKFNLPDTCDHSAPPDINGCLVMVNDGGIQIAKSRERVLAAGVTGFKTIADMATEPAATISEITPAKKVTVRKSGSKTPAAKTAPSSRKRKTAAREPSPDPADLDSDADYDPAAKASTRRRHKLPRSRVGRKYTEEPEDDNEHEEDDEQVLMPLAESSQEDKQKKEYPGEREPHVAASTGNEEDAEGEDESARYAGNSMSQAGLDMETSDSASDDEQHDMSQDESSSSNGSSEEGTAEDYSSNNDENFTSQSFIDHGAGQSFENTDGVTSALELAESTAAAAAAAAARAIAQSIQVDRGDGSFYHGLPITDSQMAQAPTPFHSPTVFHHLPPVRFQRFSHYQPPLDSSTPAGSYGSTANTSLSSPTLSGFYPGMPIASMPGGVGAADAANMSHMANMTRMNFAGTDHMLPSMGTEPSSLGMAMDPGMGATQMMLSATLLEPDRSQQQQQQFHFMQLQDSSGSDIHMFDGSFTSTVEETSGANQGGQQTSGPGRSMGAANENEHPSMSGHPGGSSQYANWPW